MKKDFTINSDTMMYILYMYVLSIFVWDYTLIYKIFMCILVLGCILIFKDKFFLLSEISLSYSLFILYFFIHTLLGLSVDFKLSLSYLSSLLMNLLPIMACTKLLNSPKRIMSLMKVCIKISFFISIYIIILDFDNILSGHLGDGIYKPFTNSIYSHNDISMICALSILFLEYFSLEKIRIRFNFIYKIYFLFFIILTGARKSLIFAMFALIIYPCIATKKNKKTNIIVKISKFIIAIFIILLLFYLMLKNEFLYNIIGHRFEGYFSGLINGEFMESSAISRDIMKDTAKNLIKNNIFLGYGLDTFRTFQGSFGTWSHNNYLEILVSGGIIPLFIYYSFYFYCTIKLYKKDSLMSKMFFVLMLFLFVHDYLSVSYGSRMIGLFGSITSAYLSVKDKETFKQNNEV